MIFSSCEEKDVLKINQFLYAEGNKGTSVMMTIYTDTDRTTESVMSLYSSDEDMNFDKTEVALAIMSEDGRDLISRTQAKRLLRSLDKFKVVTLDFKNINEIGMSFADEVFRIFQKNNPHIHIITTNTTPAVKKMISRAQNWEKHQ